MKFEMRASERTRGNISDIKLMTNLCAYTNALFPKQFSKNAQRVRERMRERKRAGPDMTKVKSRQRRGKFMCAAANPKQLRHDLVAFLRMTMAVLEWTRSGSSCGQQRPQRDAKVHY